MRVMIIGCGRVGSVLANRLDEEGHQVVVLDRNQQAFRRLSEKFSGERMVGNGLVEEYCAAGPSRKDRYPFCDDRQG